MTTLRHDRIPNANSPRLVTRLLEMVARGVRSTRGLQEALGVEGRTILYYTQAADWLGMLRSAGDLSLTPLGLEYVYADEERPAVYARAVRSNPFIASLLGSGHTLPDVEALAQAIAQREPELSAATARRRASAVRSLVSPALGLRPHAQPPAHQLALPLSSPATHGPKGLLIRTRSEYDPDVYRYVLRALLEHGELTLGHLRGLLDRAEAATQPLGGYIDMAIQRGDARRSEERLVVTPAAVQRKALVATTTSVMLSDAGYREYLQDLVTASNGGAEGRLAEIRSKRAQNRYRDWDERLFGQPASAETLRSDLNDVILDRSVDALPVALPTAAATLPVEAPFLDVWTRPGLSLTYPPYLAQLGGGVAVVNRMLKSMRQSPQVGLPNVAYRPILFHGGILHPGEPVPRSVPDMRSLRMRAVMHAPILSLTTALLLAHRNDPSSVSVVHFQGAWHVTLAGKPAAELLQLFDAFASSQGWLYSVLAGPTASNQIIDTLEALGLCLVVGSRAILAEKFFWQLRDQAEEMEVARQLSPLAEAIAQFVGDAAQ
jgi:hypothetical protein